MHDLWPLKSGAFVRIFQHGRRFTGISLLAALPLAGCEALRPHDKGDLKMAEEATKLADAMLNHGRTRIKEILQAASGLTAKVKTG